MIFHPHCQYLRLSSIDCDTMYFIVCVMANAIEFHRRKLQMIVPDYPIGSIEHVVLLLLSSLVSEAMSNKRNGI